MPSLPGDEIVNSSSDPTKEELNNDQSNEAKVDGAISNAGGGETANLVQANAAAYSEAMKVVEARVQNDAVADNAQSAAQAISSNGYDSVSLVAEPISSESAGPVPWGGVPKNKQYDKAELIQDDPDKPVRTAADQYDDVWVPMPNKPDSDSNGTNEVQSKVSPKAQKLNQMSVEDSSQRDLAYPDYADRKRSRCLKLTVGLVAGTALAGLASGLAYYFAVVFKAGSNPQPDSTPPPTPPEPPVKPPAPPPVPAVPTGLQAVPDSQTSIMVFWIMEPTATGYIVKRDGVEIGRTLARVTSLLDTGLTASTSYCYTVAALNAGGASADSAKVCTMTSAAPPPAPAAPGGLTGLPLGPTSLRFSWLAAVGATTYLVKRRLTTETNFIQVATVSAATTRLTHDDTGLLEGTEYAYTVAAQNAAGTSADADFLVLRTLDACEVLAEQLVQQWNQLDEGAYWDSMIAWITSDNPSFDCQFNVARFALGIADKSAPPVLDTEAKIQAEVDALVAAYHGAQRNTLTIYTTLKTLTASRGQPVARFEKLNVLSRVLAELLEAPNKP